MCSSRLYCVSGGHQLYPGRGNVPADTQKDFHRALPEPASFQCLLSPSTSSILAQLCTGQRARCNSHNGKLCQYICTRHPTACSRTSLLQCQVKRCHFSISAAIFAVSWLWYCWLDEALACLSQEYDVASQSSRFSNVRDFAQTTIRDEETAESVWHCVLSDLRLGSCPGVSHAYPDR